MEWQGGPVTVLTFRSEDQRCSVSPNSGGDVDGYVSPFSVSPECYKIVAEDDSWYRVPSSTAP